MPGKTVYGLKEKIAVLFGMVASHEAIYDVHGCVLNPLVIVEKRQRSIY